MYYDYSGKKNNKNKCLALEFPKIKNNSKDYISESDNFLYTVLKEIIVI